VSTDRGPIRIVLVDDHLIVLQALEQLLAGQPDFDVIAACPNADLALTAILEHRPDVLVLDLRMPGTDGLAVLSELRRRGVSCRTILLTAAITTQQVVDAMGLGVAGLVLKESPPDALLSCIRQVYRGETCLDPEVTARALHAIGARDAPTRDGLPALTAREVEVVRLVAQGHRNRAIADRLAITEGTVKVHLHNIYEKLGIDGRLELLVVAQHRGLI
jgi:DNA-binding NarL/FixJ family response regulator